MSEGRYQDEGTTAPREYISANGSDLGMQVTRLFMCRDCGAAVIGRGEHDRWHETISMMARQGSRLNAITHELFRD